MTNSTSTNSTSWGDPWQYLQKAKSIAGDYLIARDITYVVIQKAQDAYTCVMNFAKTDDPLTEAQSKVNKQLAEQHRFHARFYELAPKKRVPPERAKEILTNGYYLLHPENLNSREIELLSEAQKMEKNYE